MKLIIFIVAVFLIAFCISCNSNKADATNNKTEPAVENAPSTSSTGEAVFSYNLDGAKISGGEVEAIMLNNSALITKSTGNPDRLSFFLDDVYKENTETFFHSLRFSIPGKTGTTELTADEDKWNVELFLAPEEGDKYILYGNGAFTVSVSNISATRISGSFSGNVKKIENTGAGKNEFSITDGKFDIPLRMETR